MDLDAILPQPLALVFARLATRLQLGDWLPAVLQVEATPTLRLGLGAVFTLSVQTNGRVCATSGEMIAYEPPWLVAFRLVAEERTYILPLTGSACDGGTRVQISQTSGNFPLRIDLDRFV